MDCVVPYGQEDSVGCPPSGAIVGFADPIMGIPIPLMTLRSLTVNMTTKKKFYPGTEKIYPRTRSPIWRTFLKIRLIGLPNYTNRTVGMESTERLINF